MLHENFRRGKVKTDCLMMGISAMSKDTTYLHKPINQNTPHTLSNVSLKPFNVISRQPLVKLKQGGKEREREMRSIEMLELS